MKRVLAILGPTGTGKTDLALKIAKKFNGELVSADSRQIFKKMDVGTGKENSHTYEVEKHDGFWLLNSIPIHLYDILSPDETFSVAEFQQRAFGVIGEIHKKEKLPIIVGGTGLYIRAVLEGLKMPKVAPNSDLRSTLSSKSSIALYEELQRVDPETASKVDASNPRRMIRALEVFHQTGTKFSELKGKFQTNFQHLKVGLTSSREVLYRRVDERVDGWFKEGFIEEVQSLVNAGYKRELPSMSSLGYRQVIMYLEKQIDIQEAKQRIKWEQHGYIRRQLTWFKKESNVHWFDIENDFYPGVEELVNDWLDTKRVDSVE